MGAAGGLVDEGETDIQKAARLHAQHQESLFQPSRWAEILAMWGARKLAKYIKYFRSRSRSPWRDDILCVETFKMLELETWEVEKLHDCFVSMDTSGDGAISALEFLDYCNVERSGFSLRAFSTMDEDGSGELDFREFVISSWNYCSFAKKGLILFAYELYDCDFSGTLSVDEAQAMFLDVFGTNFKSNKASKKIFEKLEDLGAEGGESSFGEITKDQFVKLVETNMNVLLPAFQMQGSIQSKVVGQKFWEKIAKKRVDNSHNANSLDFKKLGGGGLTMQKKLDTKTVMKKHHIGLAKDMLEEMQKGYKSKLIGRLGEYNPVLDTDRRVDLHYKLRELNYELMETLQYRRELRVWPEVLLPRDMKGEPIKLKDGELKAVTFVPQNKDEMKALSIEVSKVGNLPAWRNNEGGTPWDEEVEEIIRLNAEMSEVKNAATYQPYKTQPGYEIKGQMVEGKLCKIVVDENSKLVDWTKLTVLLQDGSQESVVELMRGGGRRGRM